MGVICILLGIITILCFVTMGALAANALLDFWVNLTKAMDVLSGISTTQMMIVVISVFTIIGLFIGLNLIMNGLTYNKVSKMYRMAKRKARQ